MHKRLAMVAVFVGVYFTSPIQAERAYPLHPNPDLTPGTTCSQPDYFRYPEQIPYCTRSVSRDTKQNIIRTYDRKLGYDLGRLARSDIKIDHYIPLCMGGSNEVANLWPQYKVVYEQTDAIEGRLCELLAAAKLTQAEAILKMRRAKNDFSEITLIWEEIADL